MKFGDWVEVGTFATDVEANIIAGMLNASGIDTTILSSEMSTILGAGATWAPLRLMVPASKLEEAKRLIASHSDRN